MTEELTQEQEEPVGGSDFPRTQWSMIRQAGSSEPEIRQRALEEFCKIYWLPLYAFARRRGFDDKDAEDVTQDFLIDLMERGNLRDLAPERGKLRMFLFRAMGNFLNNKRDERGAQKRGGDREFVSFERGVAEGLYLGEFASGATAEQVFDRHWIQAVLTQVLGRLQEHYEATGRGKIFGELSVYLALDGDDGKPYSEVGANLGQSVDAVKVAVSRLRKRYRKLIREEIQLSLDEGDDPEVEIEYLIGVLTTN